jgi:hypothetical protein
MAKSNAGDQNQSKARIIRQVMKMNCGNYVRKTSITLGVFAEFSVQ